MSEWFSGLKFGRHLSIEPRPRAEANPGGRPPADPYRDTTQEQRDKIRAWRRAGWTIGRVHAHALTQEIEVSRRLVTLICADIPGPRANCVGRRGADAQKRAAVVADLASGMTHRAVAAAHGVSLASVWNWSKGLTAPRKPGPAVGWKRVTLGSKVA